MVSLFLNIPLDKRRACFRIVFTFYWLKTYKVPTSTQYDNKNEIALNICRMSIKHMFYYISNVCTTPIYTDL